MISGRYSKETFRSNTSGSEKGMSAEGYELVVNLNYFKKVTSDSFFIVTPIKKARGLSRAFL
jgi:hypothetical protein